MNRQYEILAQVGLKPSNVLLKEFPKSHLITAEEAIEAMDIFAKEFGFFLEKNYQLVKTPCGMCWSNNAIAGEGELFSTKELYEKFKTHNP